MRTLKDNYGFSVVEMLLAIVIAGLIMGAIGSFLMIHIKSFETTLDVIDVQYEGQLAFNTLGTIAMESQAIDYISDGTNDLTATNTEILDPISIVFINGDGSYTSFYYDKTNKKILFMDTPTSTSETARRDISNVSDTSLWYDFAFNIASWKITPGVTPTSGIAETYAAANNMYVYMELEDDGSMLTLSNLFEFRNVKK
jgi:prepilin-type N-terminal cleavage/methylation domain-containing protein